jgi:hypothetical protein
MHDSGKKICLQKKSLGVEHHMEQQKRDQALIPGRRKPVAKAAYRLDARFVSRLRQYLAQALYVDIDD